MDRIRPPRQAGTARLKQAEDALERAFTCEQDRLVGMLYCLIGDRLDARDAFQASFARCWRRLDGLAEVEGLRAWIFRVALNVARDMRGSAWRRYRQSDFQEQWPANEQAGANGDAQGPSAALRRGILKLPCDEREVLLLRINGQMTYEQIAEVLHVPPSVVKTRMRQALGRLYEAPGSKG